MHARHIRFRTHSAVMGVIFKAVANQVAIGVH